MSANPEYDALIVSMLAQLPSLLGPTEHSRTAYISRMFAPAQEPTKA